MTKSLDVQLAPFAPSSSQITPLAYQHSAFYRPDALPAAQVTVSQDKSKNCNRFIIHTFCVVVTLGPKGQS